MSHKLLGDAEAANHTLKREILMYRKKKPKNIMFILYNLSDKSSPNSLNSNLVWASLVAQTVKSPPAMWETWVRSLGWEDPLEESMAACSGFLAWRIPMDRGARQAVVHGVAKSQIGLSD